MIKISPASLDRYCARYPAEFRAALMEHAVCEGGVISFTREHLDATRARFSKSTQRPQHARGLGDLVASVATPIARAFRLPCIDPETKQLRPESGCAKRKAALNAIRLIKPHRLPTSNP